MTLYAALGQTSLTSDLYSVDPYTGTMTSIGPIGFALTGMAWDDTTSTMFGATSSNSFDNQESLITIDLVTGAGTLIGGFSGGSLGMSDIACDSSGNLFGWTNNSGGLYSINKATGVATDLGGDSNPGQGGGIAFDSTDVLWKYPHFDTTENLYTLNTSTGNSTNIGPLSGFFWPSFSGVIGSAVIGPDGIFYAADRDTDFDRPTPCALVVTTYPAGLVTYITTLSVDGVDAIAFDDLPGPYSPTGPFPPALASLPGDSFVFLGWNEPYDNGSAITGYNVYRGLSSGTEVLLTSLGTVTNYTDNTVSNGTQYFYKVTAVNGLGESILSNETSSTPDAAAPDFLYAAQGTTEETSDLYVVDQATGVMISIGPIGYALTGMAWDDTTSTMYGATNTNSAADPYSLITINLSTGAGTLVGAFTGLFYGFSDIVFDSAGNLFGWANAANASVETGLYSINKATAVSAMVGPNVSGMGLGEYGNGMAIDSTDTIWLYPDGDVVTVGKFFNVDPATGIMTELGILTGYENDFGAIASAKISSGGIINAIDNPQDNYPTPATQLVTISPGGTVSFVVDFSVHGIDALAFAVPPGAFPASAPDPPLSLDATAGNETVALSWSTPAYDGGSAITGYNVYRGTSSGTEVLLISLGVVLSYDDNTVVNDTTYWYEVTAVNANGESAFSNEDSAFPRVPAVPSPPLFPSVYAYPTSVDFNWTTPADDGGSPIIGYNIYRGTSSGGETLLANAGVTTLYTDTTVEQSRTYYYYVTAVNAIGESAPSTEQSTFVPQWVAVSTTLNRVYDIAYTPSYDVDGYIVAVGRNFFQNSFSLYSYDGGKTWNSGFTSPSTTTPWECVARSEELGLFIAGRQGTSDFPLLSSTQGLFWTLRGPSSGWWIHDVCWSPELAKFVAVGSGPVSGSTQLISLTSTDGITWTVGTSILKPVSASVNHAYGVCWSPALGIFVAVGTFRTSTGTVCIATSTDGVTWQTQPQGGTTANLFPTLGRVKWFDSHNLFVAAIMSEPTTAFPRPGIVTSPNGINWTQHSGTPFTASAAYTGVFACAIGESPSGLLMAGGYGHPFSMASTGDGSHWNGQPSPFDSQTTASNFITSILGIPELGITVVGWADL